MTEANPRIRRRAFVRAGGSLAALALVPGELLSRLAAEARGRSRPPSRRRRFLTEHELETLRALCAQLIPGPPADPDPGAVEAGVPEAIDLLLSAFLVRRVPRIHAGGPFSNRAGSRRDDFARFVPLDRHARLGWRLRIEGSRGRRRFEFGGPVRGLQEIYREGLAHLDERAKAAGGSDFASLPSPLQAAILGDQGDAQVQELVGTAFGNALELMYGPPEYGANRDLVGWRYTRWPGDVQPRGFSDAQVSEPDRGARRATRSVDLGRLLSRAVHRGGLPDGR